MLLRHFIHTSIICDQQHPVELLPDPRDSTYHPRQWPHEADVGTSHAIEGSRRQPTCQRTDPVLRREETPEPLRLTVDVHRQMPTRLHRVDERLKCPSHIRSVLQHADTKYAIENANRDRHTINISLHDDHVGT